MVTKIIEDNFVLEKTNLWRCKECGGTYENENECLSHLKECDAFDLSMHIQYDSKSYNLKDAVLIATDVKEFIRRLKENYSVTFSDGKLSDIRITQEELNKIVGEELI